MSAAPDSPSPSVRTVPPAEFASVIAAVAAIEAAATAADGHASLGEAVWRDLQRAGVDSAGFLVAGQAYCHVARNDNFSPQHWAVGLVLHPDARDGVLCHALLGAAREHIAARGGGHAVLWVFDATPRDDTILAVDGFAPDRDLYEMRVDLPREERPAWPPGTSVRPFEPGRDEAAWLEVNNRAFGNHPEQGGWIEATLARRMAEPWFDPALFLLAFDDDGLAGFNWLKVHDGDGRDPALGEIFVIGVDPRAHGTGLGRALALEGLDALAGRGLRVGSLFCAADNAPALRLYRSIGFTVHRVDRAYGAEVAAS